MNLAKENFLRTKLVACLQQVDPRTTPEWGKMNVQQMVEHLGGVALRNASGRLIVNMVTPADQLEAMRDFLFSNKPFFENTVNPLLPADPIPVHYQTTQAAIGALQQELIYFFDVFEKNPDMVTRNPFFGDLNFEQNVQLLYKHAFHHLRQFRAEPPGY